MRGIFFNYELRDTSYEVFVCVCHPERSEGSSGADSNYEIRTVSNEL